MLQTSISASANTHVHHEQEVELIMKPPSSEDDNKKKKKKKRPNCCDKYQKCAEETSEFCHEIRSACKKVNVKAHLRKTFSLQTLYNKLPIIKWIPSYRWRHLQGDLIAGVTVGLTVIPQSLAYARIAELPPQYGLYTAFMCSFVYVLLGTSRDVNLGPTAVMSLLTAEFTNHNATLAVLLAFISGVIQIAMGVLQIGFVIDYISHPVINSFTTAAAITIACSQVKNWLGLKKIPRDFINQVIYTLAKLPQTKVFDFVLGLVCMIILYVLKRLKDIKWKQESVTVSQKIGRKIIWLLSTARNAIVVIFSAGLAAVLLHHDVEPFSITGNITASIPTFKLPEFTITTDNHTMSTAECFQSLGIGIVIVPLVGVIESIAIGKAFGRKNGYNIDGNQELLANGVSNLLGSFVSAYPISASFSRSAVMAQSGVQTPAVNIFTGTLVLLSLAFLTPLFYYIPNAALAAVIMMAVTDMIDFSMIKHLWHINKIDLFPWFTTFFISLLAGFEYGILIGVVSSLLLLLYPWARPSIKAKRWLGSDEETKTAELLPPVDDVVIISIPMGLMFPGVDYLQEKVEASAFAGGMSKSTKAIILDFSHVFKMDYTAVMGLKELVGFLKKKETPLVFLNMLPLIIKQLQMAKIKDLLHAHSIDEALEILKDTDLSRDSLVKVIEADDMRNIVHRSLTNVESEADIIVNNLSSNERLD